MLGVFGVCCVRDFSVFFIWFLRELFVEFVRNIVFGFRV